MILSIIMDHLACTAQGDYPVKRGKSQVGIFQVGFFQACRAGFFWEKFFLGFSLVFKFFLEFFLEGVPPVFVLDSWHSSHFFMGGFFQEGFIWNVFVGVTLCGLFSGRVFLECFFPAFFLGKGFLSRVNFFWEFFPKIQAIPI